MQKQTFTPFLTAYVKSLRSLWDLLRVSYRVTFGALYCIIAITLFTMFAPQIQEQTRYNAGEWLAFQQGAGMALAIIFSMFLVHAVVAIMWEMMDGKAD